MGPNEVIAGIRFFRSDRGPSVGYRVSISGKRNCYDNAAVERFVKSLKAKPDWRRNWQTRREIEIAISEYITGYYNPRCRHATLGWHHPSRSNMGPLNMNT